MVVGRQVQPALHRSRIAEPSALYIADPAPQAGGDGQDNDGQRETHGAFGDQHADQDQQAVARQESGRQQAVLQKQDHEQQDVEGPHQRRVRQRLKILLPQGMYQFFNDVHPVFLKRHCLFLSQRRNGRGLKARGDPEC